MKRTKSLFEDIVEVDDAETIRALAADERVDRIFVPTPPGNGILLRRILRNLSYKGTRFPHMVPRGDEARVARHDALWQVFNAKAAEMAAGPEELAPLAKWIRNETDGDDPGILVQQLIGQFLQPGFKATPESWQAALILREDSRLKHWPKMLWWRLTKKATRAKQLLGGMVNHDIVAMHGIAVALHNLVATAHLLRAFYADANLRKNMTPEQAVEQSLSAPPVVYRQALAKGAAAGCPFSKYTLFLLKLKDANKGQDTKDMVFMAGTWSRCPAEQWVPAVIAGLWNRAVAV